MKHLPILAAILMAIGACDAFTTISRPRNKLIVREAQSSVVGEQTKTAFLEALDVDRPYDLNVRSEIRTKLLNEVIDKGSLPGGSGISNPGSDESFASVAPGSWRVVYAPHMTTMAGLLRGEFSVGYDLRKDGTITSHARYEFPLFNLYGYLSTSGTYGSVDNRVCRVDFNEAWVRPAENDSFEQEPYPDIESVPDSIVKFLIRNIGRAAFIEAFAVFPVSYLDNELIVFDFELLGTRICARKEC